MKTLLPMGTHAPFKVISTNKVAGGVFSKNKILVAIKSAR